MHTFNVTVTFNTVSGDTDMESRTVHVARTREHWTRKQARAMVYERECGEARQVADALQPVYGERPTYSVHVQ